MYKNYDPRAKIIKDVAEDVFKITGRNPLIDIAKELEKIARSDDYFVSRKLYPNVDFYSGQSYRYSPTADSYLHQSFDCNFGGRFDFSQGNHATVRC